MCFYEAFSLRKKHFVKTHAEDRLHKNFYTLLFFIESIIPAFLSVSISSILSPC